MAAPILGPRTKAAQTSDDPAPNASPAYSTNNVAAHTPAGPAGVFKRLSDLASDLSDLTGPKPAY
jgi:hypothetical protein